MKLKLKLLTPTLTICLGLLAQTSSALITINTVPVGDIGNPNDVTGFGAVSYSYSIGTYEVTLNQYTAFLNAVAATDTYGLYSFDMESDLTIAGIKRGGDSGSYNYTVIGSGNRPVTQVSWFDAARFVNWLHNGQPTGAQAAGTTETGAYALNGALSGVGFARSTNANYGLPTENEWYKAAYYQPAAKGGDTDGYWLYPTAKNVIPNSRNGSATDANSGNFERNILPIDGVNDGYAVSGSTTFPTDNALTDVGAFSVAASYYGTFDQGGNVWEWIDEVTGLSRVFRGGGWYSPENSLRSTNPSSSAPGLESRGIGFRVVIVPEPGVAGILGMGIALLAWKRKRKF